MEAKGFRPMDVEKFSDTKQYVICSFFTNKSILTDEIYVVDKKNKKIFCYMLGRKVSDDTGHVIRLYEKWHDKGVKEKIGCDLFRMMMGHDEKMCWLKVLYQSDSAKETLDVLQDIRILQAEFFLKVAKHKYFPETEESAEWHLGTA